MRRCSVAAGAQQVESGGVRTVVQQGAKAGPRRAEQHRAAAGCGGALRSEKGGSVGGRSWGPWGCHFFLTFALQFP